METWLNTIYYSKHCFNLKLTAFLATIYKAVIITGSVGKMWIWETLMGINKTDSCWNVQMLPDLQCSRLGLPFHCLWRLCMRSQCYNHSKRLPIQASCCKPSLVLPPATKELFPVLQCNTWPFPTNEKCQVHPTLHSMSLYTFSGDGALP